MGLKDTEGLVLQTEFFCLLSKQTTLPYPNNTNINISIIITIINIPLLIIPTSLKFSVILFKL